MRHDCLKVTNRQPLSSKFQSWLTELPQSESLNQVLLELASSVSNQRRAKSTRRKHFS